MDLSKITFLALLLVVLFACNTKNKNTSITPSFEDRMHDKLYPYEDFFDARNYPDKKFDFRAYQAAVKNAMQQVQTKTPSEGEWIQQGPGNIGGRITSMAIHPSDSTILFIGSSRGGLFKSTDSGATYKPVFDDKPFMAIGEVTFDPSNPNIMYVGTGDPNISGYPMIGDGVYKSTDMGETWFHIGLEPQRIISRILVAPTDPDVIYVSAMGLPFEKNNDRGLYKSINGGNTWEQILLVNDSTGIIDVVLDPTNENIVYAAGWNRIRNNTISKVSGPDAKIFKTIDGGQNWTTLENGLPQGEHSRIGLAMSLQDPSTLYAMYARSGGGDSCAIGGISFQGLYKTIDAGSNWTQVPTNESNGFKCNILGGFGWYFGQVRVNPSDHNDIFVLGVEMMRSRDGGVSWYQADPPWWTYEVHADKHDLIFSGNTMYLGTDGGAYKSDIDLEQWTDIENIPANMFYRVAYNPFEPDTYYGGMQDNGSSGGNESTINEWTRIYGGDGFQMAFDYSDPNIFYVETQNGRINVTVDGGNDFNSANSGIPDGDPKNWDMPYMISAHNPKVMYTGTNRIYKNSLGEFVQWFPASDTLTEPDNDDFYKHDISTLHESPINEAVLYAGTSDGLVWRTTNGGNDWEMVNDNIPRRYVSDIKASPNTEANVYVGITGYKYNEFIPHIFKSTDYGTTWEHIGGDLPNLSVNDIYVLPDYEDRVIFVATDGGIYFTIDGGTEWNRLGMNMPFIPVYDLEYNPVHDQIIAGTFARSIQTFDLSQINLDLSDVTTPHINGDISVYPTLVDQYVNVQLNGITKATCQIVDPSGNVISTSPLSKPINQLDLSALPSGMYFIHTSNKNYQRATKIFKH